MFTDLNGENTCSSACFLST